MVLLFWVKHHLPEFQGIAEDKATTMGHIQRHHLSNAEVLVPPKDKLKEIDQSINPIFQKIKSNQIQIRTLTQLRDTLLPKLMSGEVRVKDSKSNGNLFFKKVTIENLRCFQSQDINLNVPDGIHEGSGLNILIGENANGKTTVLDAINFITQSTYSSENKLSINDFFDKDKEIVIRAETNEFIVRCRIQEIILSALELNLDQNVEKESLRGSYCLPLFR